MTAESAFVGDCGMTNVHLHTSNILLYLLGCLTRKKKGKEREIERQKGKNKVAME
jgi:hypothetical protein